MNVERDANSLLRRLQETPNHFSGRRRLESLYDQAAASGTISKRRKCMKAKIVKKIHVLKFTQGSAIKMVFRFAFHVRCLDAGAQFSILIVCNIFFFRFSFIGRPSSTFSTGFLCVCGMFYRVCVCVCRCVRARTFCKSCQCTMYLYIQADCTVNTN